MPRKNAKRREKVISRAMGKRGRKQNPALEAFENAPRVREKKKAAGRVYASDDRLDTRTVITGTFSYSGRGFGFVTPDEGDGTGDVFIPPRETSGAMSGDRVTVSVKRKTRTDGEGAEGEVLSVEPVNSSIIGTLHLGRGWATVTPDARRFGVEIAVPVKDAEHAGAKDGWKVEVVPSGEPYFTRNHGRDFSSPPDMPRCDTVGRIAAAFGSGLTCEANYAAILASSGIRTEFAESVLAYADERAREEIILTPSRTDLRGRLILTIDGAGAKDLDDAISLERTEDGWILGVHIADVSHYVRPDSPAEVEARLRGTSVYFTDKVVPMLPESLSNGACSLNAGEDKYALSAEMTLDREGRRIGTRIFKSVIRSRVRGVYTEVNDLFERGERSPYAEKYREVLSMLLEMKGLYELLAKRAKARGVLELEDAEAVILLDDEGHPADIVRAERGDAEKLIEQFMLEANMGVAETLLSLGLPGLYRTHEKPDREKVAAFAAFVSALGLSAHGITPAGPEKREPTPREMLLKFGEILDDAEERGVRATVSQVLLRSMMKAKYQSVCAPHFGLGAEKYCHFTSPIRRYPDLFVHSVLTAVLEKTGLDHVGADVTVQGHPAAYFENAAYERGLTSSDCELRALEAERGIEDLYMTLYMADRIGEEFDVTVISVTKNGMFVSTDKLVEGFVPASAFPAAKTDEERMTLTVGRTVYTLGSRFRVKLTEADVSARRITFSPLLG